jgi:alkaline phosphatase D
VVQPDDHDVYHGNLWGWGGRLCPTDHNASGGYICAPYFVNMVHRTQTSHNPGPYDPAPALNGITNYYGAFTYGGVGFAVLEDRKFKTPPDVTAPKEQTLLGETQLRFLEEWGADWEGQAAKVVVSQTVYAAMHCRDDGTLFVDPDCNGFPKAGRDRAVRAFREAGAFVFCGDQHLATFAQLGIGDPSHGVYQFCVPAMGNIFWRWFYPAEAGANRAPGMPEHLGDFTDPWGNPFRMLAVANPEEETLYREAGAIRSRHLLPVEEFETGPGDSERTSQGDGYGIIRLDKAAREITAECWPHNARPSEGDEMFQGWPVTVPFETPGGE